MYHLRIYHVLPIGRFLIIMLMTLPMLVSCGIMEIDDSVPETSVDIYFEHDTLYVMEKDTFTITPVFVPDDVKQKDIYWVTEFDSIVHVSDNVFTAVSSGWSRIIGRSMTWQVQDQCHVCVMTDWQTDNTVYPYETIIYADVTVNGEYFNPDVMQLGAFISDRLRGVGRLMTFKDKQYVRIRVGSEWFDTSGDTEQTITFMLYDRRSHTRRTFTQEVTFDGETHGTLGNLYQLTIN